MASKTAIRGLAVWLAAWALLANGGGQHEDIVLRLNGAERRRLESLRNLSASALEALAQAAAPERVRARTGEILALGPLTLGARAGDARGDAPLHTYVRRALGELEPRGVRLLGQLDVPLAAPVRIENTTAGRDRQTRVTVGQASWPLAPLWPNGAMPSLAPKAGLQGPLVHVGKAEWNDLKGRDLKGAIALMSFGGHRHWVRLLSMGCQAVIVYADGQVNRENAEGLFANTPIPMPRYYVDAETGAALRDLAEAGQSCRVEGGHVFETRVARSLFAYLPPSPPLRLTVQPDDLLARIAADFDVRPAELMTENRLAAPEQLKPGQVLDIPGRTVRYTVREGDLLLRLAREYGVTEKALVEASGLKSRDLTVGQTVVIPNAEDSLLLLVRLDSMSVAPDAPHGAKSAANLAATLTALEHLASDDTPLRRRGLVVGFLDGDHVGGAASRAVAEHALLLAGQLQPIGSLEAGRGTFRFFVTLLATLLAGALAGLAMQWRRHRHPEAAPFRPAPVLGGFLLAGFVVGLLIPLPRAEQQIGKADSPTGGEHYRSVIAWFGGTTADAPTPDALRWFLEGWLMPRFERERVAQAEARIKVMKAELAARDEPDVAAGHARQRREIEARIARLVALRDATFGNLELTLPERARTFREAAFDAARRDELSDFGLDGPALAGALTDEFDEERAGRERRDGNRAAVQALLDALHPGIAPAQALSRPTIGWIMDMSAGSPSLATPTDADGRAVSSPLAPLRKQFDAHHEAVAAVAAIRAGWSEPWTFVRGDAGAEFAVQSHPRAPTYLEFWTPLGVALAPLSTVNDRREYLDTPLDIPERFDFTAFATQVRTATLLIESGLESTVNSGFAGTLRAPKFGRIVGRTLQFNIRSGIDAQDPVPRAIVYFPQLAQEIPGQNGGQNTATRVGTRVGVPLLSQINGAFAMPLESLSYKGKNHVLTYTLDSGAGIFSRVLEAGQIGTQKQKPIYKLLSGQDAERNLILTAVYPLVLFPGVDPQSYASVSEPTLFDAVQNGPPQHFGLDDPLATYNEKDVDALIVYMEPGRRMRAIFDKGAKVHALLVGELESGEVIKGLGHPIGPRGGDRNLTLPMTPLVIAREFQALGERRRDQYLRFGIRDTTVDEALVLARSKLDRAEAGVVARDWQVAVGSAREAWGTLLKTYPAIQKLGREAVFSVVILMALLVPAGIFLERLILGGKTIMRQLTGAVSIFVAGTLFLNYFHPAFQIAVSPFIVMIAFTMILMSSIVLGICYQRFEVLVRRARISGGEAESEEISLASSLATALSLGVSNLKKRPARTALTAFTVSVLTFSIVTFVSVKGRDQVFTRALSLDQDIEGARVAPEELVAPPYTGVLFRAFNWGEMGQGFLSAVDTEYGSRYSLARRGFYIEAEGGNNADREGVNQIEVAFQGRTAVINGLMTLEPVERDFTALHRAVSGGVWFDAEETVDAQRFQVILPDYTAATLGIAGSDLLDADGRRLPLERLPLVRMMNNHWRVIGILDAARADRLRDINGKSLAMVDHLRSAITPSIGSGFIENEAEFYHLSWRRLGIVPLTAARDVGASVRSVAVRFGPDADPAAFRIESAARMDSPMFGNLDGTVSLMTMKKRQSVGGIAKIIVPVILCILIVTNTMMGTVEERKGEVQMLGAIGLSPSQISFLLLSESGVFSVLGIIVGTFGGLLMARGLAFLPGLLSGLSFNFTSLASILLAMGTGLVVLIATLVPARKAAALAAPSGMEKWVLPAPREDGAIVFHLPFTLTKGNAIGMAAFLRRFLLNHAEATSEDFNCRQIAARIVREPEPAIRITAQMWLAPYDLDVAQDVTVGIQPSVNQGVFHVVTHLHRRSGTEEAWLRTNHGFLDLVRQQFLIWRNLGDNARRPYIDEGAALLRGSVAGQDGGVKHG